MNTTIARPALGQRCKVRAKAGKFYEQINMYTFRTRWQSINETPECEAHYIGYRTVYSGLTRSYDEYSPSDKEFIREQSHTTWVFVANERENPFYAFPADVEVSHAD